MQTHTIQLQGSKAVLVLVAFVGVFMGLFGLAYYLKRKREKGMEQLARQKGWQKLNTNDPMLSNCIPPYLRDDGGVPSYDMAYQASLPGGPLTFLQATYQNGQPRSGINIDGGIGVSVGNDNFNNGQSTTTQYSVACFQIPQNYGSLLIFRHFALNLGSIGEHRGMEKFNLEGDFNKYFEVYGLPGTQVEAYSLLTPDVMATLVDNLKEWNVHFVGNTVYMATMNDYIKPGKIEQLLNAAGSLQQQLASKPLASSLADHSMSVSTNVAPVTPVPGEQVTPPPQPPQQ